MVVMVAHPVVVLIVAVVLSYFVCALAPMIAEVKPDFVLGACMSVRALIGCCALRNKGLWLDPELCVTAITTCHLLL